jgi:hypothetical protein
MKIIETFNSSWENETIEDIVADIRMQNQGLPEDANALSPLVCDLLRLADRIEAAHKREQEDAISATVVAAAKSASEVYEPHIQSAQVGNAAKMREALSDACYAMFNFLKTQYGGYEEMAKALDKSKAALAASPRNCDRFASLGKASVAFHEECPVDCDNIRIMTFDEWLFSKAAGDN